MFVDQAGLAVDPTPREEDDHASLYASLFRSDPPDGWTREQWDTGLLCLALHVSAGLSKSLVGQKLLGRTTAQLGSAAAGIRIKRIVPQVRKMLAGRENELWRAFGTEANGDVAGLSDEGEIE